MNHIKADGKYLISWSGQKLDECRNLIGGWALWEGGGQGDCLTCNWEFNHVVPSALGTFLAPVCGFRRVRVLFISLIPVILIQPPQGNPNPQICKKPLRLLDSGILSILHVTIDSTSHQLPSSQVTAHLSKSVIIELSSPCTVHTPHKTWVFYYGKDQALLMPMNLCPVDLVGACWANGQRRRIVQLESILNVSQLAIRAPASPGSTAAILLFSPSLSLSPTQQPAARTPTSLN